MSFPSKIEELQARNRQIALTHKPIPLITEIRSLNLAPLGTLIITCADPRNIPEIYLGLGPRDALVIRNVCGHVSPVLNDILALDHYLGLHEVLIIHHTDCGALYFSDSGVREAVKVRVPGDASIDGMNFGAITDIEESIKEDLDILKTSPLVRKELAERSRGFVFDIKTGLIGAVEQ